MTDTNNKRHTIPRPKLIDKDTAPHSGFGAGSGDTEMYTYSCACGKGRIIEYHDNIPGFRDHTVVMSCEECSEKYTIDTSGGIRNWTLVHEDC